MMWRYTPGVSSQDADAAFHPTGRWSLGPLVGTVYLSLGRPRVLLESGESRIDVSWEVWGDLVAGVGERLVTMALRDPDILEAVRQAGLRTFDPFPQAARVREAGP